MQKIKLMLMSLTLLLFACAQTTPPVHIPETAQIVSADSLTVTESDSVIWSKTDLLGKFDPANHQDFESIRKEHTGKTGIYMRKQAYEAYSKMHDAALRDKVHLTIISATRNFDYQKKIWENKWAKAKYRGWKDADIATDILRYSSMPGTSRHHWGTDIDLNSVDPSFFAAGEGKKMYDWLIVHAGEYGFAQTYTSKSNGRTGYEEEKWHWSYMPLSKPMLDAYNETISYEDITGFKGSDAAAQTDVFKLYVNGIEPSLLK